MRHGASCPRSPGSSARWACCSPARSSTTCARATSTRARVEPATLAALESPRCATARAGDRTGGEVEWLRSAELRYGGPELGGRGRACPARRSTRRGRGPRRAVRGRARAALRRARRAGLADRDPRAAPRRARAAASGRPALASASGRAATRAGASASTSASRDGAVDVAVRSRRRRAGAERRAAADRRVRHDRRRSAGLDGAHATGDRDADRWSARDDRASRPRSTRSRRRSSANALASIADEMATTIFRTAHSTVVRDGMDFSAALCDPRRRDGRAGGHRPVPPRLDARPRCERLLAHYGDRMAARRRVRHERPVRRRDPPAGHLRRSSPSSTTATLIGFATTTAHHGDVGGRLPGSSACDNTEIFQEGIRLPWLRLYAAGEPVEDVFEIIRANVRIPRMTLGDLAAQVAACTVAERALQELAERLRRRAARGADDRLVDHTERLVRARDRRAGPTAPRRSPTTSTPTGSTCVDVPIDGRRVTIAGDEVTADLARVGADGARRAQLDALVRPGVRLPGGPLPRSRSRSRTRPARSGRSTC